MYKLISIEEDIMTRYVSLIDLDTNKTEYCFDDSELCLEGQVDFSFMTIGETYRCKILLFGRPLKNDEFVSEDCLFCKQSGEMIKLGIYNVIPVESNNSIYYIMEKDLLKADNAKEFWFKSSRRDLVQVNDVVSARLLR